jgi:hypothetical protein
MVKQRKAARRVNSTSRLQDPLRCNQHQNQHQLLLQRQRQRECPPAFSSSPSLRFLPQIVECAQVSIYGFGLPVGVPHHYHNRDPQHRVYAKRARPTSPSEPAAPWYTS